MDTSFEPRNYLRPAFEDNYAAYCGKEENTPRPPFEYRCQENILHVPYEEEISEAATPKARLFKNEGYTTWIPKSAITEDHGTFLKLAKWFKKPNWEEERC